MLSKVYYIKSNRMIKFLKSNLFFITVVNFENIFLANITLTRLESYVFQSLLERFFKEKRNDDEKPLYLYESISFRYFIFSINISDKSLKFTHFMLSCFCYDIQHRLSVIVTWHG